MREHLTYIRTYKDALRLKLNATEDLLINGRREPKERGICRHLLGKIDRAVIERAVAREPLASDPAARARMLAGAIRLTADIGVLLDYLETLGHVRSHTEAAQAFAEVAARIEFASLSAARLARLLQVLTETFTGHDRVQVLFGLLAQPAFRHAFDGAESTLPPAIAEVFAPLRAVHRRLHDEADQASPTLLAHGLEQVLSAPDPILRAYAEPLRVRMLEMTLRPEMPAELTDRAATVLLSSLDKSGRMYARVALRRAALLLARHDDDQALGTLDALLKAQPDFRIAGRWRTALAAPRVARFALTKEADGGRLVRTFWLDGQRAVWIRTAIAADGDRLADEAALQTRVALPGVAAVIDHGVAGDTAYVAVDSVARRIEVSDARALGTLAAIARILHALALAGVALPDAELVRFLQAGDEPAHLVLADFHGAAPVSVAAAVSAHAGLAADLARALLTSETQPASTDVARALDAAPDLPTLIAALDRALLQPHSD